MWNIVFLLINLGINQMSSRLQQQLSCKLRAVALCWEQDRMRIIICDWPRRKELAIYVAQVQFLLQPMKQEGMKSMIALHLEKSSLHERII